MSHGREHAGGGLSITGRFSLLMSLALLVVMAAAGFFLLDKSRDALEKATRHVTGEGAAMTAYVRKAAEAPYTRGSEGEGSAHLKRFPVIFHAGTPFAGREAIEVSYDDQVVMVVPADLHGGQGDSLYGLVFFVSAMVIAVGAGVAFWVATTVTQPIEVLVDDVRSIARGNLRHKSRVRSGGEVLHLARQIDRMAQSLQEAQDNEVELGVREREREVAHEVREALLPRDWPEVAGYALGGRHVDSAEPGGDFHDFVEVDGRFVLIVCEVSGRGVPGALVGATARAYLRSELERGGDLTASLRKINRSTARDVRRGMYVTALIAVLDPDENTATVACAGHKLPLVRWDAAEKQVRLIQPGGIALGFDRGPIFDRSLELARVPLGPGDRLVLSSTGPVQTADPDGEELGEKRFYRLIARNAGEPPQVMLDGILTAIEAFADGEDYPADLTLAVLARS